jgi:tetratricopeptide (TPR) repeat protein
MARRALKLLESGQPEVARRWLAWCLKDSGSQGEWHSAVIAPLVVGPEGSPEALRLLAVVLGGFAEGGAGSDAILEAALGRELTPAARAAVRIVQGYRRLEAGDDAGALAAAEAVLRDLPGSSWAQALRLRALGRLGRVDEVRRLAAAARSDPALTPEALRFLGSVAARGGALAEGIALLERIEEVAVPTPTDLNNLAWQRLFLDEVPSSARVAAQRSVDRSSRADADALHTLATVLAETGEPGQAAATLRKAVAEHGDGIHKSDWLVVGRIAAGYGLASDARAAYQRIEKPKGALGLDSWTLAQRWNARLDASARRPPGAPDLATPDR